MFSRGSSSASFSVRSEEHTSELQSRFELVCRLLLEKKKYLEFGNVVVASASHERLLRVAPAGRLEPLPINRTRPPALSQYDDPALAPPHSQPAQPPS